jgi:hypothetical protein
MIQVTTKQQCVNDVRRRNAGKLPTFASDFVQRRVRNITADSNNLSNALVASVSLCPKGLTEKILVRSSIRSKQKFNTSLYAF